MNAIDRTTDATRIRLDEIRARLGQVRADRWSHEFTGEGERIVVTRAVFDHAGKRVGDEAPSVLLSFGEDAAWHEKEFLREAREDIGFVLDLLSDAGRTIRDLRARLRRVAPDDAPPDPQHRAKNLSAEASIKCGEPAFQKWLKLHHATDDDGDLSDSAAAAAVLRRVLDIESRKQLNTDRDAAARWRDLRADYQAWVQG